MKKTVTAVAVGYGNRGEAYCKYAESCDDLKIVGVVDPNEFRRNLARDTFSLPDERCFSDFSKFLSVERFADCVIDATMDELHVQTALPIMEKGYDLLLEKPITNNREDLEQVRRTAEKSNVRLVICHVLRYTPFYKSIKELVDSGELGRIVHLETVEAVGVAHACSAYIRGKWRNSVECGSSMLLAKCCHDLDLLCWLNSGARPINVSSFGGRNYFIPQNSPEGSGNRCLTDCRVERDCPYSARKLYLEHNAFPQLVWAELGRKTSEITPEQREAFLRERSPHGMCVFKTDADIVDRQTLILEYANGSTASHTMLTAAPRAGRSIHIFGTRGEIEGFFEDSRFVFRRYCSETLGAVETEYRTEQVSRCDGHMGGDSRLVGDFVRLLQGESPTVSLSSIEDSVYSHLCVFAADRSMRERRVIPVE